MRDTKDLDSRVVTQGATEVYDGLVKSGRATDPSEDHIAEHAYRQWYKGFLDGAVWMFSLAKTEPVMSNIMHKNDSKTFICGSCTREFVLILEPNIRLSAANDITVEAWLCPFCGSGKIVADPSEKETPHA